MDVLLAVDFLFSLVQELQHLPDDGLQRTAQFFPAVRLSERRHVNEGSATTAQVQRCIVGEITEVPAKDEERGINEEVCATKPKQELNRKHYSHINAAFTVYNNPAYLKKVFNSFLQKSQSSV